MHLDNSIYRGSRVGDISLMEVEFRLAEVPPALEFEHAIGGTHALCKPWHEVL
jgi:hypothetical protein